MASELRHVADLATIQRDRNGEIRVALFEGPDGCAVELRKYRRRDHSLEMVAAGPGIIVFADRIPELIAVLDKAQRGARALREAAHA